MPNGTTDIFKIDRDALLNMLRSLGDVSLRCIKIRSGDPGDQLDVEELHGEVYWVRVLAE